MKNKGTKKRKTFSQKSNSKSISEPHNEIYTIVKSNLGNDHISYKKIYSVRELKS